jgi:hypothetical protein
VSRKPVAVPKSARLIAPQVTDEESGPDGDVCGTGARSTFLASGTSSGTSPANPKSAGSDLGRFARSGIGWGRRVLADTELRLQHWVDLVDDAVNPERRADQAAALVRVGELDLEITILAAERKAERRLASEHVGLRWQVPAATGRARRQHHSEDAGSGQQDRSRK